MNDSNCCDTCPVCGNSEITKKNRRIISDVYKRAEKKQGL